MFYLICEKFADVLSKMDSLVINVHCIDTEFEIENKFHMFVSNELSWLKFDNNKKQFNEHSHE